MIKQSLWLQDLQAPKTEPFAGNIKTDVLIIGAGMAGVLCAYHLQQAGIDCLVVEADRIGHGMSGHTTAKITAQHGLIYQQLIAAFGKEKARQYYEVNQQAVDEFIHMGEQIPCDLESKTAYLYSLDDLPKLEKEAAAYAQLGISSTFIDKLPLPLAVKGALGMAGQAQFHPLKLLYALAEQLKIYQQAQVLDIVDNVAILAEGTIKAEQIILASHFPLINVPGGYFMKMYQQRSYLIALDHGPQIDGMYLDSRDNGLSFRNYADYLLIGGGGHKTGKEGGGYQELLNFAEKAYPEKQVSYAWSAQDCMTLDKIPYIGVHSSAKGNIYVATGFNKWGMSGSMAAAKVLTELLATGRSDYPQLFAPNRSMLHGQLLVNFGSAVGNLLRIGRRCPHLGCALRWNKHEHSWDCPCHGSRFDEDGSLINNPAKRGLKID